jgi:hypothetical protein
LHRSDAPWRGEHVLYDDVNVFYEDPFERGTPDDGTEQ